MAKSKNHTNHNQSYKDHRNGIKGVARNRYLNNKNVNQKLLRNLKRAKKFDPSIKKQKNLSRKIDVLRQNKTKILAAIKAKSQPKVAAKPAAKPAAAPAKAK